MRGAIGVTVSHITVAPGTVSLDAMNRGGLVHELVVLALNGTERPGERPVGV